MLRLLFLFVWSLAATTTLAQRPNVVIVMTDDQGYGDLSCHGNPILQTPNLDRLHGESVRLTNFHVDPTCSPTRSALLSGRYSTRTGVWHTIMGRSLMHTDEVTLAEHFAAAGYATAAIGKWHLGDNYPLRPQDQGFQETFIHGGGGVGQGPDHLGNDYFDDVYLKNGEPVATEGYCTDVWFDAALDFLDRRGEEPFLLYLATNAPHGPYLVPDRYREKYTAQGVPNPMNAFYGMIENIDDNMARLTAKLDELGLTENTIFVFVTDNGTAAGWRPRGDGYHGFNAGMRGTKGSEYEGGHRVPCFVHWPAGGVGGGRDVDLLAAHVDVVPTLCDLAGVPLQAAADRPLDGASVAALLRNPDESPAAPLANRTLFVHSQRIADPEKWRKSAVMTARWRLINGAELYDLSADDGQTNDVAGDHDAVVADLRGAYDAWWESLRPVFDDEVRLVFGEPGSGRQQLMSHDWRVANQRNSAWHQNHVRQDVVAEGPWAVEFATPGRYRIELRRRPDYQPAPTRAVRAELRLGERLHEQATDPADEAAVFLLDLEEQETFLTGVLIDESGERRGSYYAYVEKLE